MSVRALLVSVVVGGMTLLGANDSSALIIDGPSPLPGFEADDGSSLFIPTGSVVGIEIFDLVGSIGGTSSFGFFFAADPGTLIQVFGPTDEGPPSQSAAIDFASGIILDIDAGVVENTFTTIGALIGFYLATPTTTLLSPPGLNPGGTDVAASFPATGGGSHLIGFEIAPDTTVGLYVVSGLTSFAPPVPEPASLLLLGLGLAGLSVARRSRTPR